MVSDTELQLLNHIDALTTAAGAETDHEALQDIWIESLAAENCLSIARDRTWIRYATRCIATVQRQIRQSA